VNCEFCDRDLHLSHYENNREISVYDCTNCPMLISYHFREEDGNKTKVSFMLDRKNRVYVWTNNYAKNISYIVDVSVTLHSSIEKDPLILRFPKIMNITPNNVLEKLSFYLTFS
jgi:hypothetical protein